LAVDGLPQVLDLSVDCFNPLVYHLTSALEVFYSCHVLILRQVGHRLLSVASYITIVYRNSFLRKFTILLGTLHVVDATVKTVVEVIFVLILCVELDTGLTAFFDQVI